MRVKDLLDKFGLTLNLHENILNIEVDGEYSNFTQEPDDDVIYYIFSDSLHEIIINDVNDIVLEYTHSNSADMPPSREIYLNDGLQMICD